MNWLRWYHGTTKDSKLKLLAKQTGTRLPDVVTIWAALLEYASESATRGTLSGWNDEEESLVLDIPRETVETVRNAMKRRGMFHVNSDTLTAWEKRNPKRERDDNSTERVQRFRERKHQVTPGNATKHPEESREEKKREEKKETGIPAVVTAAADSPKSGHKPSMNRQGKREPPSSPEPERVTDVDTSMLEFGEFKRCRLSAAQYDKLLATIGESRLLRYIRNFDLWVNEAPETKASGVPRKKRHAYESILQWVDRDAKR